MESHHVCACKGKRSCLICEATEIISNRDSELEEKKSYIYCAHCMCAWLIDEESNNNHKHPNHEGVSIPFPGVHIVEDFVTAEQELMLVTEINKTPWVDSQSGRRKQDYGPKVNFKKKRLKMSCFTGLPSFSKILVDKMKSTAHLEDFEPVELCNLEYTPERGSSIDAHFDDFWLWGERLVTLTLLSDTKHTMTLDSKPDIEVIIPLPRRSLVIVTGEARHTWKHAIKRDHITSKRIALTFRELTGEFLQGGDNETIGEELLNLAASFNGVAIAANSPSG